MQLEGKLYPWYTITNCPTDEPGYTGRLYVVNSAGGKFYFPKEWTSLAQVITYMLQHYTKIGFFSVSLTWFDQLSHNYPWFPGIALNRKTFYGEVSTALENALHEVMHNFGWGKAWGLWPLGHSHISPMFSTGKNDPAQTVFGRFVTFLQQARVVGGKSLWQAILEQAK